MVLSRTWRIVVVAVLVVLPLWRARTVVIVPSHVALRGTLIIGGCIAIATIVAAALLAAPTSATTTTTKPPSSRSTAPVKMVVGSVRARPKVSGRTASSTRPIIGPAIRMVSVHVSTFFECVWDSSNSRDALQIGECLVTCREM